MTIGASRLLLAGMVLLALLRWTRFFGAAHPLTPDLNRLLWWWSGLNMALYIVAFIRTENSWRTASCRGADRAPPASENGHHFGHQMRYA